ncbi:hypothetical protein [Desulfoscipio gibsoniae]|nr:hypothetical protein [Desulfoscipio gibsoniae]
MEVKMFKKTKFPVVDAAIVQDLPEVKKKEAVLLLYATFKLIRTNESA